MHQFSNPVRQKSPLTCDDLKLVYDHLPRPLSHDNLLFPNTMGIMLSLGGVKNRKYSWLQDHPLGHVI